MGREIRRVPPNWEHPRRQCPHNPWSGGCNEANKHNGMCYQPLFDESFTEAARRWKEDFYKWERGERPSYCSENSKCLEFWEYESGPPNREFYRPEWKPEETTWYQVYETVSEGTPVTPPFATKEELIDYLAMNGDFWDQHRGHGGWDRLAAEKFVTREWAPSLIAMAGTIYEPRDGKL